MKQVKGYEGLYYAQEDGQIISAYSGKSLKSYIAKNGYAHLDLRKNKKARTFSVHRIIAESFIPNPENKAEVNHKNGIKSDNRVENLEWVSRSENLLHRSRILGQKRPHLPSKFKKKVICLETGKIYNCAQDYHIEGKKPNTVGKCIRTACSSKRIAYGFHWRFL